MKFELSYSILYHDLFKSNSIRWQQEIAVGIDQLSVNSAQLLSSRLKDPFLVERMSASLQTLNIDSNLDFNQTILLLVTELAHRQSLTNCFIWQQQINYSVSSDLQRRDLSVEEQSTSYFAKQVLAHGLRWGWSITELMGRSAIVLAETQVVLNHQTCSCGQPSCAHRAFLQEVRAQWDKMPYCIKLVDPTLT